MQAVGPIAIPKVRLAADYDLNQQAAEHHGPMMESGIAAAPYLRHKEHLDMYDDQHAAEYDADDQDMAWLDSINSKVSDVVCRSRCALQLLGLCAWRAHMRMPSPEPAQMRAWCHMLMAVQARPRMPSSNCWSCA